ncbi:MAG: hypothetical protein CME32_12365 [Gimesia sp.]|nr:hypothetical protein [Gimesia sp.]
MQQTSDALPDIKLILELISKGSSLNDTLSKLVEYLESKSEDMVCSILLLEENRYLRHGAAPNLPDEYIEAIDGTEIGPATGSCGTAAYFNQQVVVTDISTDPLWNDYKSYALKHRLCACWSTPIRSSTGDVLGTFAIYYHKPGEPTDYHRHLIEQAVYLAAIAIEHVRIEADLQKSEQESHRLRQHLQEAIESLTEGIVIYDSDDRLVMCNSKYLEIYSESRDILVPGQRFEDHIRISAYRGQVADAVGREEEWIKERICQHQNPAGSFRQKLCNGRWLKISEQRTAEGGISGVRTDITQQVLYEEKLRKSIHLIETIRRLLSQYISDTNPDKVFDDLLQTFLNITESESGFFGEVRQSKVGNYELIPRASCYRASLTADWDCAEVEKNRTREFFEQQGLFERIITDKESLIVNDIQRAYEGDTTAAGRSDVGVIKSFLVLPVFSQGELSGVAGIANCPSGYDATLIEFIKPLLAAAGTLLTDYRNEVRRQENERALQISEERFAKIFRLNPIAKGILSLSTGSVIDVNESFLTTTRYQREEVVGKTIHELQFFPDASYWEEIIQSVCENGHVYEQEIVALINGGEKRIMDCSAWIIESDDEPLLLLMIKDLTEQRQTEEQNRQMQIQLQHSQKIKAIGQLAAGVAHEFNNILVGINLNAELLLLTPDEQIPEDFREPLREIQKSGERAAELVKQLLAFGRKKAPNTSWFDVNALIMNHRAMIQRILGDSVKLILNLSPMTGMVWADEAEIEQALMNLVVNARDAMVSGGELILGTQNVNLTAAQMADQGGCLPGIYTLLTVADTGCGMTSEVLERIFEPFFTTKPAAEGTGLGLSTVQRNLSDNGGFVSVESQPEEGTQFRVYLPQEQRIKARETRQTETPTNNKQMAGGSETILVCDDEPIVLSTISALLSRLGYKVLRALGPVEALKTVETHTEAISLLCTDFNMPQINGVELAQRLMEMRPGLKVVYLSGIAEKIPASALTGGSLVIQKPANLGELSVVIRQVLDEGANQKV